MNIENSKNRIIEKIELEAAQNGGDYIGAALRLADELGWSPEWIADYIRGPLKEKLAVQGKNEGLLKKDFEPSFLFE